MLKEEKNLKKIEEQLAKLKKDKADAAKAVKKARKKAQADLVLSVGTEFIDKMNVFVDGFTDLSIEEQLLYFKSKVLPTVTFEPLEEKPINIEETPLESLMREEGSEIENEEKE